LDDKLGVFSGGFNIGFVSQDNSLVKRVADSGFITCASFGVTLQIPMLHDLRSCIEKD